MTGIKAIIAEACVSAIIRAVVKTGSSYFSDKYKEHQGIKEMLDSLEASLPRIRWVLSLAEQKLEVENAYLADWLQQLKDVTYEAEDVMDDFAAIQIRDSLKNEGKVSEIATSSVRTVKNMFLSDNNEKKLKDLLGKIKEVCDGIDDLTKFMESENKSASDGSIPTGETSSFLPKNKKIFGRDKEIELILGIVLMERQDQTKSTPKNEVTQRNISKLNLLENTSNVIANSSKGIEENISKKGKEKAESSDLFSATEEHVNPIGHKFSSTNLDQPPVGDDRFLSSQNIINPISKAPAAMDLDMPSSGGDQFPVTDKISTPLISKKPKLSHLSKKPKLSHLSRKPKLSHLSQKPKLSHLSKEPKLSHLTPVSVGHPSIRVLPIIGIEGIGKTTIAQIIYNHSKVTEYFDLKGWVYVTNSPKPKNFVYDILCSFDVGTSKSTTPITSLSDGHDRLKRAIQHKRFLLVFDDVREGLDWINLTWRKMIEVLADGEWGSTVIVTTDSKNVATTIGTLDPVSLGYLPPEQFLGLFLYFAFGHNMKKCNREQTYKKENHYFPLTHHQKTVLKPIGEKIAEKLHGLPLAAEVIGSFLSAKTAREDWERILESDWWNLEVSKHIITPLGVGFQTLDPDLKQCFIYCSLFPRNYVFEKEKIVQMWIAHGFIHPTVKDKIKLETEEIQIEDIGRSKFDKLVDRFFFQNTTIKNKYVMHDLIRELAIAISSEMLYVSGNCLKDNKNIPSSVRHLAIDIAHRDYDVYVDDALCVKYIESLRTIMFFGFSKMSNDKGFSCILEKQVRLRSLYLSYFASRISLPFIGNISHLRFLDLSFSKISEIPKSLCELVHLQVLDIRGCYFSHLPDEMNRLINLRHLYASPYTVSLIRGIGRLRNLQELEEFHVREEEGFTISELSNLKSLNGQLTLTDVEKIPSKKEATSAKLEGKKYLTSLKFDMTKDDKGVLTSFDQLVFDLTKRGHHQKILDGLKPHKSIRELSIENFLSFSFPSWVMEIHEMNNLTSIQLVQCSHLETLPSLGTLPSLEVLKFVGLQFITCIGNEFYGTSDVIFPSLRELIFQNMRNWKTWSHPGERKHFPCLQKLKIEFCYGLLETPLHCLRSMVELHLSGCDMVTKNIGTYFAAMTSLTRLYLGTGPGSLELDLCCDHLRELRVLTLRNISIAQLERKISTLVSLNKLTFNNCFDEYSHEQYLFFPQQLQNLHSLPSLACIEVFACSRIPGVLLKLGRFPSLRTLWINYYVPSAFMSFEESWLEQLSSLEDLELSNCKSLMLLPPNLSKLSSLKKFTLKGCLKIYSLPQEGLPRSLKELHIIGCSAELMQGCQPNTGAEWSKISHVPCIRVKGFY